MTGEIPLDRSKALVAHSNALCRIVETAEREGTLDTLVEGRNGIAGPQLYRHLLEDTLPRLGVEVPLGRIQTEDPRYVIVGAVTGALKIASSTQDTKQGYEQAARRVQAIKERYTETHLSAVRSSLDAIFRREEPLVNAVNSYVNAVNQFYSVVHHSGFEDQVEVYTQEHNRATGNILTAVRRIFKRVEDKADSLDSVAHQELETFLEDAVFVQHVYPLFSQGMEERDPSLNARSDRYYATLGDYVYTHIVRQCNVLGGLLEQQAALPEDRNIPAAVDTVNQYILHLLQFAYQLFDETGYRGLYGHYSPLRLIHSTLQRRRIEDEPTETMPLRIAEKTEVTSYS